MKEIITAHITQFAASKEIGTVTEVPGGNQAGELDDIIITIINWILGLIGLVAVVVIIIGGIQYMTSTGDPGKVKKAKDTILYGIIGLIIAIFAAAIVNFVVTNIGSGAN